MILVSIIINNYNYVDYVEEAILSALNQDYPNCEVILVDDGSTDKSRNVIDKYTSYIKIIYKNNGGQASAYNVGYASSKGDVVIFLDSDDKLKTDVATKIANNYSPLISKYHGYLELIDNSGTLLGQRVPKILESGDLADEMKVFGTYGSPPGSGNAFSRVFLDNILPMQEDVWRIAADTYPILMAPFYGTIANIDGIFAEYRIHTRQGSEALSFNNSPNHPSDMVRRQLLSKKLIHYYLSNLGHINGGNKFLESVSELKFRLISYKFFRSDHPYLFESNRILFSCLLETLINSKSYNIRTKFFVVLWFCLVLCLPKCVARPIAIVVVNPRMRPKYVNKLINILSKNNTC